MIRPSLALIPSAYNTSKIYSAIPSNGDGDFEFLRSTVGSRINKDGFIESIGINTPRLDFSNKCPYLLLEPQRTNLFLNSEPISAETVDLDIQYINSFFYALGNVNSVYFGDNSTIRLRYGGSSVIGNTYVLSCFIRMDDGGVPNPRASEFLGDFSISIGNATVMNDNDYKVEYLGNEIYRVSAKAIAVQTSNNNGILKRTTQSNRGFTCTGFQLEQGESITSYIKTSGVSVVRGADICRNAGNSDIFKSNEGVLFLEASTLLDTTTEKVVSLSDGTSSNSVQFRFSATLNELTIFVLSDGGFSFATSLMLQDASRFNKLAIKWKENDFAVWVNGVEIATSGLGESPKGLDVLSFNIAGVVPFQGVVKSLRYYDKALTDLQIEELTR